MGDHHNYDDEEVVGCHHIIQDDDIFSGDDDFESRYAKMIDWADLTEENLNAAVGSSSSSSMTI